MLNTSPSYLEGRVLKPRHGDGLKPEGKRPLGRPRRRWVDNIKRDLRGISRDGMDWFDVTQDRDQWRVLMNTVLNLRVPYNAEKFLSGCSIGNSSRRIGSVSECEVVRIMLILYTTLKRRLNN
jgi:hypothetical protein